MSHFAAFTGDSGKVQIDVHGYENPRAVDPDDANWLRASVLLGAGPFSGSFDLTITTHDLAVLRERLGVTVKAMTGSVEFETTEGDLILRLAFSTSGRTQVSGIAQPSASPGTALHFQFESAPDDLYQTLQQLAELTEAFPIRQFAT